jgi:hypothetical protein
LQLLDQPGSFEIGREFVQPGAVLVLQIDECCYRRRGRGGMRPIDDKGVVWLC